MVRSWRGRYLAKALRLGMEHPCEYLQRLCNANPNLRKRLSELGICFPEESRDIRPQETSGNPEGALLAAPAPVLDLTAALGWTVQQLVELAVVALPLMFAGKLAREIAQEVQDIVSRPKNC